LLDSESGLQYFGARYLSNNLTRFTAVDPTSISFKPKTPQSWNRYVYSLDNPLNLIDPDGRNPLKAALKWSEERLLHVWERHVAPHLHPGADKFKSLDEGQRLAKETFENPDVVKTGRFGRIVREKEFVEDTGTEGQKKVRLVTEPPKNGEEDVVTAFPIKSIIGLLTPAWLDAWLLAKEETQKAADEYVDRPVREGHEQKWREQQVHPDGETLEQ
jgi:RHS repeat-associated protein